MSGLLTLARACLDVVFPRSKEVRTLEESGPADLRALLRPAGPIEGCEWAHVIFEYRHPLAKAMVWEIKYHGNRRVAGTAAELMCEELVGDAFDLDRLDAAPMLLIPVPLSRERMRERGFNQAERICSFAAKLGAESGFEYAPEAAARVINTKPQARRMTKKERLSSIKGCFSVPDPKRVEGRDMVIVDDVITTGATVSELRNTLLAAGARSVRAWALCH